MISQHTNYTVVHCERFRTLDHHYSVLSSLASFRLSPVLSFFFLLLADLNLGPLPRQPCLFPQMLMKKVVNLKIRLQKCVRILQSPLSAPAILPPHLPTIWKDSQDWHSVRERFSPKIWHSGKQRTEREPAFRCYQVSWEPCAPPSLAGSLHC